MLAYINHIFPRGGAFGPPKKISVTLEPVHVLSSYLVTFLKFNRASYDVKILDNLSTHVT